MSAVLGPLAAEWRKLWSVRSSWWCAASGVIAIALCAWTLANDFVYDVRQGKRPPGDTMPLLDATVPAVQLAQLPIIALVMLTMTSEWTTGSVRSTFQAEPLRDVVLLAKTAVCATTALVLGVALALVGRAAALAALGDHAEDGSGTITTEVMRVAAYCAVTALLTIGVAAVLRSAVGALCAVTVLLVGLLMIGSSIGRYLPAGAGQEWLMGSGNHYPPAVGLLVLAGWSVAAWIAGWLLVRRRDA